jgi:hypothetical protein
MHSGARTRVSGVGGFHAMTRFLGVWTYDPASSQTLVNLVVTVPSGAGLPSLSPVQDAVRFTSQHYGTIVAHTADGCRWTLAVQGNTAELDPATQTCQVASGTVTLLFWSAASDGEHQNSVMAGIKDVNGQESNSYPASPGTAHRPAGRAPSKAWPRLRPRGSIPWPRAATRSRCRRAAEAPAPSRPKLRGPG